MSDDTKELTGTIKSDAEGNWYIELDGRRIKLVWASGATFCGMVACNGGLSYMVPFKTLEISGLLSTSTDAGMGR